MLKLNQRLHLTKDNGRKPLKNIDVTHQLFIPLCQELRTANNLLEYFAVIDTWFYLLLEAFAWLKPV